MRLRTVIVVSSVLVAGLAFAAASDLLPVKPRGSGDDLLPVKPRGSGDDLLPVEPRGSGDDLLPVKPRGADDDLLPVEPRGDQDDLLPDRWPPPEEAPAPGEPTADAGDDPARKADLGPGPSPNDRFDFDLVVGFNALAEGEGMLSSYYFYDSRQGHCGMDPAAVSALGDGSATGGPEGRFDYQVFTRNAGIFMYMTTNELGRLYMRMPTGTGLAADFESLAAGQHFEEAFKPTGRRRGIGLDLSGKPYDSVEYRGPSPDNGETMSLWLAKPDFDVGFYASSCWALGVVTLPEARQQRLITRAEGMGTVFELSYVQRQRNGFSGAGYRDIGSLLGGLQGMMPAPAD